MRGDVFKSFNHTIMFVVRANELFFATGNTYNVVGDISLSCLLSAIIIIIIDGNFLQDFLIIGCFRITKK